MTIMPDHDSLSQEEQPHSKLQQDLRTFYRWRPEEVQVYQHVRERLLQEKQSEPEKIRSISRLEKVGSDQLSPVSPHRPRRWVRWVNAAAAVLFVSILVSSLIWTLAATRPHGGSTVVSTLPGSNKTPTDLSYSGTSRMVMVTEQVGWALGNRGQDQFLTVLRTTDGGRHWKNVMPTGISEVPELLVLNADIAWVPFYAKGSHVPNAVARTLDGGRSWQRFACPQDLPCMVDYVDSKHALLVSFPPEHPSLVTPAQGQTAGKLTLYSTGDGGTTWQRVNTLPDGLSYIQFLDAQTGWLQVINDTAPWQLFITHDGGHSWKKQILPQAQEAKGIKSWPGYVSLPTFRTNNEGYLFAGTAFANHEYLYTTHDGGASWQLNGGAIPSGIYAKQRIDDQHLIGYTPLPPDASYVIHGELTLLTLVQNQWQATKYPSPSAFQTIDKYFLSPSQGFVLSETSGHLLDVSQTTDGGKSWQKIGSFPKET